MLRYILLVSLAACAVDDVDAPDLDEVESDATVPGSYVPLANPTSMYESWGIGQDQLYKLAVPANNDVTFTVDQDVQPYYMGDIYLYVRRSGAPTTTTYDCAEQISNYFAGTTTGTCSFREHTGATYYVLLRTGRRYEATFRARYTPVMVNAPQ